MTTLQEHVDISTKYMFNKMMELTTSSEAFYFQDYEKSGNTYRVFNYRLASYQDFTKEFALEMRGIAFLLHQEAGPILVSRPFAKFFNYEENPFTMNLDLTKATLYEEKADGSLIATYYDPITKVFGLKSKQAFFSDQALMAESFLNSPENKQLKEEIFHIASAGNTILMELCSPANRIVLEYPTTSLKVHGIRNNFTGNYLDKDFIGSTCPSVRDSWVESTRVNGLLLDFITTTRNKEGIEGYIVHGPWGRFKIKTEWYCNLHHLKDSVSSAGKLIEAILYERIDDVKSMFQSDSFTMSRIADMENKVVPIFNKIVGTIETFYETNKHLDRKSYAIKGQKELLNLFHLAMSKYLEKPVDYKEFSLKNAKELFSLSLEPEQTYD